jgi:hypothetical protein
VLDMLKYDVTATRERKNGREAVAYKGRSRGASRSSDAEAGSHLPFETVCRLFLAVGVQAS